MNYYLKSLSILILSIVLLTNCTTPNGNKTKSVHGTEPLINTDEVVQKGKEEVGRIVEAGPKPSDTQIVNKEKKKKNDYNRRS